jgi:hypothetical protein
LLQPQLSMRQVRGCRPALSHALVSRNSRTPIGGSLELDHSPLHGKKGTGFADLTHDPMLRHHPSEPYAQHVLTSQLFPVEPLRRHAPFAPQ